MLHFTLTTRNSYYTHVDKMNLFTISDIKTNHQWTSYSRSRHLMYNSKKNTSYTSELKVNFQHILFGF